MNTSNVIGRVFVLATMFVSMACSAQADPLLYQHVLRSTAWIVNTQEKATGSAVLVDLDNRLVLTNDHVVGSATEVQVYFTAYDEHGELVTDPQVYTKNLQTLKEAGIAMTGRIVARYKDKDLALVQLTRLPIEAQALALAADPVDSGENVHIVGNSGVGRGCLWRYTRGVVRNVYYSPDAKHSVLEGDLPTNPGDSGSPVVNDDGELVGVHRAGSKTERLVSVAVELREVRAFLEWYSRSGSHPAGGTDPSR